jgi:thioredoxin:protein disulfide reductase
MIVPIVALFAGAAMLAQQAPGTRPVLVNATARVSAEQVAPGQRFQITVDLQPAPGIHVYAPDVVKYRPIAVTVRPHAGMTIVGSPRYPAAETYYYAPLKETIPVYQKPFRVVQDVAVERSAKPGSTITVAGTLSYQACDDRICYPPRTLPLTWTVRVMEAS